MEPIKYEVLLYYWILDVLRIPTVYYLLFLDLQIKRYDFLKIWIKSGFKLLFEFRFNQKRTRVGLILADTDSFGSPPWSVGSDGIRMAQIWQYLFVLVI
jgi:hypothetical protein